ncbi:MAG TPA: uroporphyrinogen-III synthase [Devosiaceae bacterium]|nr:uroporphyrinogen-III synthase [Devosiaceae bacterium]
MKAGLSLIVTRPQPDADFTGLKLRELGHRPLLAPALEFLPLTGRLPEPDKLNGLVATSANALRALKERGVLQRYQHLPAFVVGAATAETARAFGFGTVISADGSATELAILLRKVKQPMRLLYAAGRDRAADLVAMLRAARHLVITTPVYEMRPIPDLPTAVILALDAAAVDAALFYSVRSARAFAAAARPATAAAFDLPCLCLSPGIADALAEEGFSRLHAARKPSEAALFDLLATFAATQNSP